MTGLCTVFYNEGDVPHMCVWRRMGLLALRYVQAELIREFIPGYMTLWTLCWLSDEVENAKKAWQLFVFTSAAI